MSEPWSENPPQHFSCKVHLTVAQLVAWKLLLSHVGIGPEYIHRPSLQERLDRMWPTTGGTP